VVELTHKNIIVHIVGALIAGGAEKFVVDLASEMCKRGYSLHVLVLSQREDAVSATMKSALSVNNVAYSQGPSNGLGLRTILWLVSELHRIKPDLVHLHTPNTELAYYAANFFIPGKVKVVRTIHNTTDKYGLITKWAFSRNKTIANIACSDAAYQAFVNKVSDLKVIKNGISFDWDISCDVKTTYRNKLNLDSDYKHFLFVGRLSGESISSSQKAPDVLIKAWKKISTDQRVFLHIIGDGNLRTELELLSEGCETIKFYGVQSNVKEWMQACDVYVMPSRHEGLPIAGIEAVGTGIYCVFSMIKPLQELSPPGVSWHEVDSEDSLLSALNEALKTNIVITKEQVEEFRNKFSISSNASSYLLEYKL